MASIILASIALALTLLVYLHGAWRFLRFPRFWVISAQANVMVTSDKPPVWVIGNVSARVGFRGGGQPKNIIDMGFVVLESGVKRMMSGWLKEVVHVPSELAGHFDVEVPGGLTVDNVGVGDELPCLLRIDCGGEPFEAPFTLKSAGETWLYQRSSFESPISLIRFPRKGFWRVLDWIRSR